MRTGKNMLGILLIGLVALGFGATPASAATFKESGAYTHPYPTNVAQGDIVFGHSSGITKLIPGYWTHVGIIAWYDSSIGDWIVIEAEPKNGVQMTTLREFLSRYDTVGLARVATTSTIKYYAVYFAYNQLGKPYDWNYLAGKQVYGDKYYCSELVWAAYYWASNGYVDIDQSPGWSWTYGYAVAPQEVWDDGDTHIIYYHQA